MEQNSDTKDIIKNLYAHMAIEFVELQKQSKLTKERLAGYEDALWDFKIIAKDVWSVELQKVELNHP